MVVRLAAWAVFGVWCLMFAVAALQRARNPKQVGGNAFAPIIILALPLLVGLAATLTRNGVLSGLFLISVLSIGVALFNSYSRRRKTRSSD